MVYRVYTAHRVYWVYRVYRVYRVQERGFIRGSILGVWGLGF